MRYLLSMSLLCSASLSKEQGYVTLRMPPGKPQLLRKAVSHIQMTFSLWYTLLLTAVLMSDSMWGKCSHKEDSGLDRALPANSRTFPLLGGSSSLFARLFKKPILPLRLLSPLKLVAVYSPTSSHLARPVCSPN